MFCLQKYLSIISIYKIANSVYVFIQLDYEVKTFLGWLFKAVSTVHVLSPDGNLKLMLSNIRFGFCDIQKNQGWIRGFQPKPKAEADKPQRDLDYSGYHKNGM